MNELLTDVLSAAVNGSGYKGRIVPSADEICINAERIVAVAHDMANWASDSIDEHVAVERWRGVALLREMANERWNEAIRQIHRQQTGNM